MTGGVTAVLRGRPRGRFDGGVKLVCCTGVHVIDGLLSDDWPVLLTNTTDSWFVVWRIFDEFDAQTNTLPLVDSVWVRFRRLPDFCSLSQNESIQFVNVAISRIFDFCRQFVPSSTCVTSQDFDLIDRSKLKTFSTINGHCKPHLHVVGFSKYCLTESNESSIAFVGLI